jgi:vanillate O-demethylase ferredoxin subunit
MSASNLPPGLMEVRVTRKTREALDIFSFELALPDGAPLPNFSAGAHVDVLTPSGILRQYSLCNDAAETHRYLIGVLRDPGSRGGSASMHDQLAEGHALRISAPKNHFPLAASSRHSLLVAGGIGITPLLCMAERLANAQAEFSMHYCTRSRERTAFLQKIEQAPYAGRVLFHFDDGPAGQRFDARTMLGPADPLKHLYVCGPTGFMEHVMNQAATLGWPKGNVHFEYFAAKETGETAADQPFNVKLASTGKVHVVPPGKSIVHVLSDAGVDIPVSCEQGVCGTCLTRVLEGVPDHRDAYLTDEERARNDQLTPCCSRSRSDTLVLDI